VRKRPQNAHGLRGAFQLLPVLMLVSGCSGSSTAPSNRPPVVGSIGVSPTGLGIAGATSFTFTPQGAQDPDGNALTFSWTFGDGSSGTGSPAQHVYQASGTFTVQLTVSDGSQSVAAPSLTVTVGPKLAGVWSALQSLSPYPRLTLEQNGTQLSGTFTPNVVFNGAFFEYQGSGSVDSLTYPTAFRLNVPDTPCRGGQCAVAALFRYTIEGQINPTGTRIDGTVTLIMTTTQGTQLSPQVTAIALGQ
jgi:hypothetical protein